MNSAKVRGSRPRARKRPARPGTLIHCSSPPLLVAIVGGSGAGKTWLAEKLRGVLGRHAVRLSLDNFYRDRSHLPIPRRANINFDHPRAIDWAGVDQVLKDLLAGRPARLPRYDFKTHSRLPRSQILQPCPVVLLDGLWLLHRPALRRQFAVKIFIDCPARVRLQRRLERDLASRGRTAASVRKQFWTTVEPMHARFVSPQQSHADIVLPHNFGGRETRHIAAKLKAMVASNRNRFSNRLSPAKSGRP